MTRASRRALGFCTLPVSLGVLLALGFGLAGCTAENKIVVPTTFQQPTRSTSIALTYDDTRLVIANRDADTVSVLRVRGPGGEDLEELLAEIPVGDEPRFVALTPDDRYAFVSNSASSTVSMISLSGEQAYRVIKTIAVGSEPRGMAMSPNGTRLYVANHTAGTISFIDVQAGEVAKTVGGISSPTAIAITNDLDEDDTDEQVFVTRFYARLVPGGPGEGFDTGKEGVVYNFQVGNGDTITRISLSPLANAGFPADRSAFCAVSNPGVHSEIFCPEPSAGATDPVITADPQGAYPNQLGAAVIVGNYLYVPSIGAAPAPPVRFNVNVQGLVHIVNTVQFTERADLHVNVNDQIKAEVQPNNPNTSLDRLFANDLVAIDGNGETFLLVSRGGNYVLRATAGEDGRIEIGAPDGVIRFQTGNIPNGVVMARDGKRAYTNNEVSLSVTSLDLENNEVLTRDIPVATPPEPGTFEHRVLLGKLVFHTALGTPDNGIIASQIRDIIPLDDRGKASDNAWSSCASCHPDGLADGVTWMFPTGPRQTVPLDAFFAKDNPSDQRISNWSAVRGSITDFNNNSRNIQGGLGFAGEPPNSNVFNHGITQGASEALDVMTLWVQTLRSPLMAVPDDRAALASGRAVFAANCAGCHGGAKWTKSEVVYLNNPTFDSNPLAGGLPLDSGITNAGPQIRSYTVGAQSLTLMEGAGTFDAANPLEIRGAGAAGSTALGGLGFNVPSLLGVGYHAPYFHDGSAQTLEDAFALHALGAGTVATTLSTGEQEDLKLFLNSIDTRTERFLSETDVFRASIGD